MSKREMRLRSLAAADIADAVNHYRDEGGDNLALCFAEQFDVWRVLHSRRDIPGAFRNDE